MKMTGRSSLILYCLATCAQLATSQTKINLKTQSDNVDFTGAIATKPVKAGAIPPPICSLGELFFFTIAPAGANLYACTATNVWTLLGSGAVNLNGLSLNGILKVAANGLANSNLIEDADGTDEARQAMTWAAAYIPTSAAGGVTTCDLSRSNVCQINFAGGDTALGLAKPHGSGPYILRSCQDSIGAHRYIFPSNAIGFAQPEPTGTNCTEQLFTYDGAFYRAAVASVASSPWSGATFPPGAFNFLPQCNSTYVGSVATVQDSTVNAWGSSISGGGANIVLAFCNGNNWTVAAK